jgi:hypothetical protein
MPTPIGAATVSTRAITSSHALSDEEPDAVRAPVTAHIAMAAAHIASDPARGTTWLRMPASTISSRTDIAGANKEL